MSSLCPPPSPDLDPSGQHHLKPTSLVKFVTGSPCARKELHAANIRPRPTRMNSSLEA